MREQFEKLPNISKFLEGLDVRFINGVYMIPHQSRSRETMLSCSWVNGAWFMYQELHKEIDRLKIGLGQLRIYCEDKTTLPILDQWSDCYVKSHKNIIYEIDKITGGE